MQSIEQHEIDRILERWDQLLRDYPKAKRELLERLGQALLEDVRRHIGGSGKVRSWQEWHRGSKNGYAAVRPRAKTYQATRRKGNAYAVGYITNSIENGHRVRHPQPTGRDGYHYTRGRVHQLQAEARYFYEMTRVKMGVIGQKELARLADEIAKRLEGAA